jgi:hypothetical protein
MGHRVSGRQPARPGLTRDHPVWSFSPAATTAAGRRSISISSPTEPRSPSGKETCTTGALYS